MKTRLILKIQVMLFTIFISTSAFAINDYNFETSHVDYYQAEAVEFTLTNTGNASIYFSNTNPWSIVDANDQAVFTPR